MKSEDEKRDAVRQVIDFLRKQGFDRQEASQVLSRAIGSFNTMKKAN